MNDGKPPRSPHVQIYRPQLTSVLSFAHRVTGVALALGAMVLVAWLLVRGGAGGGSRALLAWLANPGSATLMVLLLTVLFWHTALGLIVVTEDYLHHAGIRTIAVGVIQLACLALAITGVMAVVRLAFTAAQ